MSRQWQQAGELIAQEAGEIPALAVVCGSGLDVIVDSMDIECRVDYKDLPGFPVPAVKGHKGFLVVGKLAGVRILVMCGRGHYYEGNSGETIALPVRALKAAGVKRLLLSSATGSLRDDFAPGALVSISDHISWSGFSPLRGPNDDDAGQRFVALEDAYDPSMRSELQQAAQRVDIDLEQGVMMWYPGPNFETPAEIRVFRMLGADIVGMSTVPEIIAAAHCGLPAASIAVVTNYAAGICDSQVHSHEETLAGARASADKLERLLVEFARGC